MADFTATISEIISGIRIVKAFNGESTAIARFKKDTQYYVKSLIKHQKVSNVVPALSELAAIGALCVVLLQGGTLILNGTLTPSDLMLFLFAVFSVMAPIMTVTNSITQFQRGIIAADRVFGILDREETVVNGSKDTILFNHSIELKNVSFKYFDKYVLRNINLVIEKGKQVAFVGSSGSGKSTMLDLIIRFYDPNEGDILIDGINLKEYDTKAYRSLFGVVSQENILFNDSVKNNISFGYAQYTDLELEQATKTSNSYNFINKMPNGLETLLGDRGVNISGGERQRIAIARALLRKPQILIFDEATSALDAESEKIVQNAINNSLEDKTAIIVAHRLSTIRNCDKIVVFDDGQIVEMGTHSELIAHNKQYAQLYSLQYNEDIKK
jgi:subfamily B ATP-binding cassette protein MsbA